MRKKLPKLGGYIKPDREELLEIDYLEKLSPEEMEWFSRFCDNYYNARFVNDGQDIIQSKDEQKSLDKAKYRRKTDISNYLYSTSEQNPDLSTYIFSKQTQK